MFEIREYIDRKEIGIQYETVMLFDDRGKILLIGSSEKRVQHRKERNIGIEYETVVALATFDDWRKNIVTEDSENEMNKNVRIRLNEYLFNRAYPFTKRLEHVLKEKKYC